MKIVRFLLETVIVTGLGVVLLICVMLLLAFILLYLIVALVAAVCLSPFALLHVLINGWPKKKDKPREGGGLVV